MTTGMDEVRDALKTIAEGQAQLLSVVSSVSKRVDDLEKDSKSASGTNAAVKTATIIPLVDGTETPPLLPADAGSQSPPPVLATADTQSGFTSRIILTTYPKQIGIKPLPMEWGEPDPLKRGPVTVSRNSSTIRRRNAIGAHGGSYSIYYALAVASKELAADHVPDFTNTEPAVNIGPFPQWGDKKKIVAMDPWGHMVPWLFKDIMAKDNSMSPL